MFVLLSKRRICSSFFPRFFSTFTVPDYLISSFGFSPDEAAKASNSIAHLKSPDLPDSVRSFLIGQGFSDAEIKNLITERPDILCSSPEKTLDPNLRTLRVMGLSTSALKQIIISNPTALVCPSAVSGVTFMRNKTLINLDICPKISLLQSHGLSPQEIGRILSTDPRFIASDITVMEDLLKRTKELGFQPGSEMFLKGLKAINYVSREGLQKKMDLFMSFGWSEDDFFAAIRNAPVIIRLKEETLRAKMDFLLGEVMCPPSYIASHPMILSYSLENRLRPRNHVLQLLLEALVLRDKLRGLHLALCICDSDFAEKYICPHLQICPELLDTVLFVLPDGIHISQNLE